MRKPTVTQKKQSPKAKGVSKIIKILIIIWQIAEAVAVWYVAISFALDYGGDASANGAVLFFLCLAFLITVSVVYCIIKLG